MYKINILVSGKGSTLDNLAFHCRDDFDGMLYGCIDICSVVADRDCLGVEVAKRWDIPTFVIKREDFEDDRTWSEALFKGDLIGEAAIHVMAGFLSRVVVPKGLEDRIINIHPSLLPKYGGEGMYGIHVHEEVIKNKESVTGITIHTVTNNYDEGMIIGQHEVGVCAWDTPEMLMEAVQDMEKKLYPRTILNYLKNSKTINT